MLRLPCPNCGERPLAELTFGGEPPSVPDWVVDADERDVDLAWMLDNVQGVATERWFHHAGCRRWFTIHRDTRTDAIVPSPGTPDPTPP